jgi:hypothetical protein
MNADVLTTTMADGIAVVTLGSAKRIYFDADSIPTALFTPSSVRWHERRRWALKTACK